jgi:hypothetical protein
LQLFRWGFNGFRLLNFRYFCLGFRQCREPMARTLIIRKKAVKHFLSAGVGFYTYFSCPVRQVAAGGVILFGKCNITIDFRWGIRAKDTNGFQEKDRERSPRTT